VTYIRRIQRAVLEGCEQAVPSHLSSAREAGFDFEDTEGGSADSA
jgi:hypothetical protein